MTRVVFISHGHPDLSKGGAEMASWNLYQSLQDRDDFECLYIARTDKPSHGGSTFSVRNNELLLHTQMTDWFNLSSSNLKPLFQDLGSLLQQFAADVVHIHHYAHIGIELFAAIKQALPEAKIVFTLHEFMAMCMHNGQMVKKPSLKLCDKPSPNDCHECFPQHSPANIFLRKGYILDQFGLVDKFISPSQFLAERYIDWGVDKSKMHVIENVLPSFEAIKPRSISANQKRGKLAFFGQINPYKGLDILLTAIQLLPDEILSHVTLDIHGANLEQQTNEVKDKFSQLLNETAKNVTMRGAYEPHQMSGLLGECDWVIIPSIWWENSPVVIQEAAAHGRPLIGANIGGMKEKIEGKCGITFEARSAASLADTIVKAIEPDIYNTWQSRLAIDRTALVQHLDFLSNINRSA